MDIGIRILGFPGAVKHRTQVNEGTIYAGGSWRKIDRRKSDASKLEFSEFISVTR